MKRNQIITISIVILSIFCACNSRSAKVEVIQEEVIEDNIDYQIPDSAFHQTTAQSIDKVLSNYFQKLLDNTYSDEILIYESAFRKLLTHYLSSPVTFNNTLDTLETLITIRQSPDKKIKFYSWDDRKGGTYRYYKTFAQYKGTKNKILYEPLNFYYWMFGGMENEEPPTENKLHSQSELFEIYEIVEGANVYYLTIGFGHYGDGLDTNEAFLFKIDGDSLIYCQEWCIQYPHSDKGRSVYGGGECRYNMEYDDVTKTLSFDDYLNIGDGDVEYKGWKTLKFSNGVFNEI
jgi:hypothetical protein